MKKVNLIFAVMLFAALSLGFTSCDNYNEPKIPKIKYKYVDLGLSVKWATCNIGASSPEEYGFYFAWGEVEPQRRLTTTTPTSVHLVKLFAG